MQKSKLDKFIQKDKSVLWSNELGITCWQNKYIGEVFLVDLYSKKFVYYKDLVKTNNKIR